MKAVILDQRTYKLEIGEVEKPVVRDGEIAIKMVSAAINHHELWTLKERRRSSESNIIMGSDGSGIVEAIGKGVNTFKTGDEVIINPSLHWGANDRVQGGDYEILGFPTPGTFSEYVTIHAKYVYPKPSHLTFQEAAALPLAGLTAYRALMTRGELEPGNKVLVTGIGGGAALYALGFAVALEAEVYVTSGDNRKISRAIELGAKSGVNYKDKGWNEVLKSRAGGFDVIIDSAAGKDFDKLAELANPGGRIALFGRTAGTISDLNPRTIFWKQLSIHGTTMGNDLEFFKMLELVSAKKLKPVIDSEYAAKNINEAYGKMDKSKQFGKIVIDMASLAEL